MLCDVVTSTGLWHGQDVVMLISWLAGQVDM